jgi:hypothetical protein
MDWTSIIEVLIGTGGITGLFIIAERKTAAALKNMQTMFDALQALYDKLQSRFDIETDKVGKLYQEIDDLHNKLDAANTRAAINELKRCDCINCAKRQPPMGDKWRMDIEGEGKEEAA